MPIVIISPCSAEWPKIFGVMRDELRVVFEPFSLQSNTLAAHPFQGLQQNLSSTCCSARTRLLTLNRKSRR